MTIHPRFNHHGQRVTITHPHHPSPLSSWAEPAEVATVVPAGPLPQALHGLSLAPWTPPSERGGWEALAAGLRMQEPPFEPKKEPAAGAVIVEPDDRVWLVAPTNRFGGYKHTFPKGKTQGMSLHATAIKEVYEESGLIVELIEHLVDVIRSGSHTRYYLARRLGGSPSAMGWESQAVLLVPPDRLRGTLDQPVDHLILDALKARLEATQGTSTPSNPLSE